MEKFIVWLDGKQSEAICIEADNKNGFVDAIEVAMRELHCDEHEVNIIEARNIGAAEYYGVAHVDVGELDDEHVQGRDYGF